MKKFLSLSLLALGLVSSQKVSADATSYLFGGASIGWTNVIQSAESGFETTLLSQDDLGAEVAALENKVKPATTELTEYNKQIAATTELTEYNKQIEPENQQFYTQDLSKFTAVYPSSRVAGEIFIGGECRNESNIFQAQVGVTWIGGNDQQGYTYNVTEQSVVGTLNDPTVSLDGKAVTKENPGISHEFNYNGVNTKTNDFKISANWGVKAMLGWGLQSGDLGLVFNVGYAGEHNKATLDYYTGDLAFLSSEEGGEPEVSTAEKKFWRHGVLLGLQLIWKINASVDALIVMQKTFYGKKTIAFDDFGASSSDEDGENSSSDVLGTQFYYKAKDLDPVIDGKAQKTEPATAQTNIDGNSVETKLERTYVGFGFRFKVGNEE